MEKLAYLELNDWTPPESHGRFIYGYLENDLWRGDPEMDVEIYPGDTEEYLKENRVCVYADNYDLSIEYWIVGPWKFFEENFPELLPRLHDKPFDGIIKGGHKAFPAWTPENYGISWIDSDEVIYGKSHPEDITEYLIVHRRYTLGKGWGPWQKADGWVDNSMRFRSRQKAEAKLKKLNKISDDVDYKISTWTHTVMVRDNNG